MTRHINRRWLSKLRFASKLVNRARGRRNVTRQAIEAVE
jgi:hypothetical protein